MKFNLCGSKRVQLNTICIGEYLYEKIVEIVLDVLVVVCSGAQKLAKSDGL